MGGREKEAPTGNSGSGGGAAIAGGKEVTSALGTGPTGLGLLIQEHRGIEGVKGNQPRLKTRPEDTVGAVVAMAGGVELTTHAKRALEAMKQENNGTGRKRGARGFSQRRKTELTATRGRLSVRRGGRRTSACRCIGFWLPLRSANAKKEQGQ